jgi:hypothetical protein
MALTSGIELGYVVTDAAIGKWILKEMPPDFDAGYYGKLLEKAWHEAAFVFSMSSFVPGWIHPTLQLRPTFAQLQEVAICRCYPTKTT